MTKPLIIDTREAFEYAKSHAEGAINIPPAEFMRGEVPPELRGVAKDAEIVVYCRSGQRSNTCSMMLREFGFSNIVNGVNEHRVAKIIQDKS